MANSCGTQEAIQRVKQLANDLMEDILQEGAKKRESKLLKKSSESVETEKCEAKIRTQKKTLELIHFIRYNLPPIDQTNISLQSSIETQFGSIHSPSSTKEDSDDEWIEVKNPRPPSSPNHSEKDMHELLELTRKEALRWQEKAESLKDSLLLKESSMKAKSALIAGLTRELKNSTHCASVLSSHLHDTDLQPNQVGYMLKLEGTVEKMANLVKEAQFYSEMEAQTSISEAVNFRMDHLLEEVMGSTNLRTLLHDRDVDLTYVIDSSVPPSLLGDYGRVKSILQRLLTNAIKGTIRGEITVSVKRKNEKMEIHHGEEQVTLSISITDTGLGIPREHLAKVFEPFGLIAHKRDEGDLGLGLSICAQLSRLLGGHLRFSTEVNKGTNVTLICPFRTNVNASISGIPFAPEMMMPQLESGWGKGRRVCVVDDNKNVGNICQTHLLASGCDVTLIDNPTTAYEEMKARQKGPSPFDVIMLDYKLAGHCGEELAFQVRNDALFKNIPLVIMCTDKQRKEITVPLVYFLYKPVLKLQLLTLIHMLFTVNADKYHNHGNSKEIHSNFLDNNNNHSYNTSKSESNNTDNNININDNNASSDKNNNNNNKINFKSPDMRVRKLDEISSPPNSQPNSPKTKRDMILLVEDNPINAKIASAVLRRHHFEVELAQNGLVALQNIKNYHDKYQLVLMDIYMPVMDGLTCTKLARDYEKENGKTPLPIIALTADSSSTHRMECLAAGCNEFIAKPLDYLLLIEILKKIHAASS